MYSKMQFIMLVEPIFAQFWQLTSGQLQECKVDQLSKKQ